VRKRVRDRCAGVLPDKDKSRNANEGVNPTNPVNPVNPVKKLKHPNTE
jgi:hypothetical protein